MDRSRAVLAVLLACLLLSVQTLNAADVEQGPILVHLKAGLDVDNEGRVSNVTFVDDERVPDAVRRDAERIARAWRFQPPSKAGKPVGGRTYAGIQACMVSSRDGIDYTFAFVGNGPAGTYRPPRKGHSPVMPIAKLMGEGVDRLGGKVVYVVAPDGTATVEEAVLDDPKLQAHYGHLWLRDQRDYFKGFRYRPELIDGVATSTRIETVSEQVWFKEARRHDLDVHVRAENERSDACRKLRGAENRQIASDSVFKRLES